MKDDPVLGHEIPDLQALVARVLVAVKARAFIIPFTDQKSKSTAQVTLGRFDLEQLVVGMLGDRAGLERLPRTLLDFDRRRFSSPLVQEAASEIIEERTAPIGSAMSFTTDCVSGASRERLARIERETEAGLLGHLDFPIHGVCPAWGVPAFPDERRIPVRSGVPTLFISGILDGRTPAENAEEVRKGFPQGEQVLIDGAGHGNLTLEFMKTGRVVKPHHVTSAPVPIEDACRGHPFTRTKLDACTYIPQHHVCCADGNIRPRSPDDGDHGRHGHQSPKTSRIAA